VICLDGKQQTIFKCLHTNQRGIAIYVDGGFLGILLNGTKFVQGFEQLII
jgi:hypothetical protein